MERIAKSRNYRNPIKSSKICKKKRAIQLDLNSSKLDAINQTSSLKFVQVENSEEPMKSSDIH